MEQNKPEDPPRTSMVGEQPAKAKRKKKKKPAAASDKYTTPEASEVKRISVKPTGSRSSRTLAQVPDLARIGSGSARQLAVPPEGGYSTGYYRVLLETKRVETLCRSLSLQYRHVAQLHKLFLSEDDYNTGVITIDEFFHAIGDEKRPLSLGIFPYVGLDAKIRQLTFDQFVLCIVTFAALSRKELLHYAFSLFDKDESGIMDMKELRDFCGNLKHKNGFYFAKNVEIAQKKLADKDHSSPGAHHHAVGADGLVDFEDLEDGSEHFQVAFFPLIQFQRNIQLAALGEAFWSNVVFKKSQIERVVHYMRLHDGHLPPVSITARVMAMAKYAVFLLAGGGKTTVFSGGPIAIRHAAITKYAEEMRQRKEEDEARQKAKEDERQKRNDELEGASGGNGPTPVVAYIGSEEKSLSDQDAAAEDPVEVMNDDGLAHHKKKRKKKSPKKATVAAE